MRKEDKFIITAVVLIGLFALYDIGHKAYDWCEFVSNAPTTEQIGTDVIRHNSERNSDKKIIPLQKTQKDYPELEKVSDEEQLHGLDKFALERVSAYDSDNFEKQTVYTMVGDIGNRVSPINAAQIENVWNPPMDKASNVKIIFTVMDDGTIKDIMLASSSGITEADNAALIAINNAEIKPFKIPNKHYIDVAMWFQVGNFRGK